jgi:hypothetical protein
VRGALVTGATLANLSALAGARSHVLAAAGWDVEHDGLFAAPAVRILVGRERHASIDKALRVLGFGKRALRVVEADAQGRLRPASLQVELAAWKGPVIVCAQLGNVDSGAFDPMDEIADVLDEWRKGSATGLALATRGRGLRALGARVELAGTAGARRGASGLVGNRRAQDAERALRLGPRAHAPPRGAAPRARDFRGLFVERRPLQPLCRIRAP